MKNREAEAFCMLRWEENEAEKPFKILMSFNSSTGK